MSHALEIWTDGACAKNGNGGWAYVLQNPANPFFKLSKSGAVPETTSQRMELMALVEALQYVERSGVIWGPVSVHTDSSYLKNCFTQEWHKTWSKNGWVNSKGNDVANRDLWEILIPLVLAHKIKWVKVKGHKGIELNEECDRLAVAARLTLEQGKSS